jgi:cytochrome c-type biogenesis protein CcmH/NrfF
MDVIASHFLAGSLLTWALPIALLILIGIWWAALMRRRSREEG